MNEHRPLFLFIRVFVDGRVPMTFQRLLFDVGEKLCACVDASTYVGLCEYVWVDGIRSWRLDFCRDNLVYRVVLMWLKQDLPSFVMCVKMRACCPGLPQVF